MIKVLFFDQYDNISPSFLKTLETLLPDSRLKKAHTYKREIDTINCILSYILLLELCTKIGYPVKKYEFEYDKYGKPAILDFPYYFNISHCNKGCVCAISNQPIGIDIQDIRKINPKLIEKVCTNNEQIKIQNSQNPDKEFIKIWAKKESIVKLSGKGIRQGLHTIDTISTKQSRIIYEKEAVIVAIAH